MTDLIERSASASELPSDPAHSPAGANAIGSPDVRWKFDTAPRRRRLGLWAGLGVVALVLTGGAVAISTVLIAPGTTIAGVGVGGMTPGSAAEKIRRSIATMEITLTGPGQGRTVTGADLGAAVDAAALAKHALEEHPMTDLGAWNPAPMSAVVTLDPVAAENALRDAVPSAWIDAVDAGVSYDQSTESFVFTPGAAGTGIDLEALEAALTATLAAGETTVHFDASPVQVTPVISDSEALRMQVTANRMLETGGFYAGEERVFTPDAATIAGWFSIDVDGDTLALRPDQDAIRASALTVSETASVAPVPEKVVVDSTGKVLAELGGGVVGRTVLDEPDTIVEEIAGQIALGSATVPLDVAAVAYGTDELARRIEVDLGSQMLYMIENDEIVDSWKISSGKRATPTKTGTYKIGWKTSWQNMGREDTTVAPYYFQPNVKWVMYFNGNQAFHGVYWHKNWGTRMSHGCVGMPEWRAKQLYEWSPAGLEITING